MADSFVFTTGDVLTMLDDLLERGNADRVTGAGWDGFFADRARPCPFRTDAPDENLAGWFADGTLTPGRVLELGCGEGRNAAYLAGLGCTVDAVDFSALALEQARARAERAGVTVSFQCCPIFAATVPEGAYDLVYDSGCFHHLPPHRRQDYVTLVARALKPGGCFGLVCFRPEGGSGYTDQQVYERASLGGGLGYTEDRLRTLFGTPPFSLRVLRQMRHETGPGAHYGEDFLWALLAIKGARFPQ
jgi:SAM-dependent methyltransferase